MAFIEYRNVGISGLSAAVPYNVIDNYNYTEHFDPISVRDVVDKIGIKQRRFAPEGVCASDLCFAAAEKLISDMNIDKSTIDLLIFISQTPDYRMPATSVILQHRLGFGKGTAAFDINLGCSAFVYGLSVAFAMMQTGGFTRVLLLDGETRSRVYHPKDRKTAFLFGDAGVAAIIENGDKYGSSFFSLNSDGSKESLIKMDAGGYRNPSSVETLTEKVVDDQGNIRTDEHGYMNGADVFNFVLLEIPGNIKATLQHASKSQDEIDYFLFHQANSYMNGYLAKKMKLSTNKVPSCIEFFGNTSSVSIPLTMASQLKDVLPNPNTLLLSGFGVGMSWATCILNSPGMFVSSLVEI